jgi:hypothetical protein
MWMEMDGSINVVVVATSIPAENGRKNPVLVALAHQRR